ncbi:SDR family oxidoreductase [Streptosporangium sandarakinum]|uniref:SDR family oxidoreductase n=1 Tax=Streptosporangium sandarakinum TaxID=1260955 RepID=UPI003713E425
MRRRPHHHDLLRRDPHGQPRPDLLRHDQGRDRDDEPDPGQRTRSPGDHFEAPGLAGFIAGSTALNRLGDAGDIADVVAFLASDAARWITGQVIDASGGLFLGPRT